MSTIAAFLVALLILSFLRPGSLGAFKDQPHLHIERPFVQGTPFALIASGNRIDATAYPEGAAAKASVGMPIAVAS